MRFEPVRRRHPLALPVPELHPCRPDVVAATYADGIERRLQPISVLRQLRLRRGGTRRFRTRQRCLDFSGRQPCFNCRVAEGILVEFATRRGQKRLEVERVVASPWLRGPHGFRPALAVYLRMWKPVQIDGLRIVEVSRQRVRHLFRVPQDHKASRAANVTACAVVRPLSVSRAARRRPIPNVRATLPLGLRRCDSAQPV